MTRKMLIAVVAVISLTFFGGFSTSADAQSDNYACTITNTCPLIEYPAGGLGGAAQPTPTPRPATPTATVPASTTTATGATNGEATIAFTGAESAVLGYVGAGLIGFGAIAVVAARRKSDDN